MGDSMTRRAWRCQAAGVSRVSVVATILLGGLAGCGADEGGAPGLGAVVDPNAPDWFAEQADAADDGEEPAQRAAADAATAAESTDGDASDVQPI